MIRAEPVVTVVRVAEPRAHVIVFGNEKGGSGKTTAALHVAVALALSGFRVGAIDLDLRQKSLSRHLEKPRAVDEAGEPDTANTRNRRPRAFYGAFPRRPGR